MNDELNRVRVASYIVLAHYNKVIELSICGLEDNPNFLKEINILKKYTKIEMDEYAKLSDELIYNYLNTHNVNSSDNSLERRVYFRISERKNVIDSRKNGFNFIGPSLSSVIASKVAIDIIKDVDESIDNLTQNYLDDEDDSKVLRLYLMQHKYTLLTCDSFSEMIALDNNFDVKKMPKIDLYAFGRKTGVPLVPAAQNVFVGMILSAIESIVSVSGNDLYHDSYLSMMEVARVKSLLPYLDKEHLMQINSLLDNDSYRYQKNSAIVKVRKIINQRKEEFNN